MHSSIPKEDRKTAEVLKVRSSTKYLELYEALFKKFSAATSRGHIVNFSWLWSKPESSNWTLIQKSKSNIMLLRFSQKKELRMRSKQRNKRKHKKKMEPSLKKRHATFREKCIRKGSEDPSYYQKWGRYQPAQKQRLNINQIPTSLCCAR